MPDAGYVRLAQGQAVALFDAGAIGADANPGHGHSDFLAIELSLGANRFIVDPGTLTYSAGAVRDNARSWNAHNGPTVIGIEPVEYLGSFKVGRRVAARLEDAGIDGEVQFARGALNFAGIGVRRAIKLSEGSLSVQDNWQGTSKPCQSAFLIPPDWRVAIVSDCEVHFSNQSTRVRCLAVAGTLAMSQGQFSLRYNLAETAHTLVAHPDSDELRLTFDWEF